MNMMNLPMLLTKTDMPLSERAQEALTMVIMGMVMVFLVLATIMLVLMVMERLFAEKKSSAKVAAPRKEETKAPVPVPTPVVPVTDDGAVIAAITAAISAMLAAENGTETYQGGFRVVSFKRSSRNTPWNSAK